jgi:hypothetical protein
VLALVQAALVQTCKAAQPLLLEAEDAALFTCPHDLKDKILAFNKCMERRNNSIANLLFIHEKPADAELPSIHDFPTLAYG